MTDTAPKLAHLRSRALVAVRGPDCRSFLQGLLTQDTETLADGEWRYGALLSPQGRLLYDMLLIGQPDAVLLDLPAAHRHDLAQRLSLYRLRAKVQVEAAEGGIYALWNTPAPGWSVDPRLPGLGLRAVGLTAPAAPGAVEVDEDAYDAHRLALGVADTGRDALGQNSYPIEANLDLLNGIDFKKGCFVGQETTSRMKRRGQVRSRLLPVEMDGGPAPAAGTEVLAGTLRAGEIVGGRDGRALALLRLDRIEGQALSADGRPVHAAAPGWLTDGIAPPQG